MFPESSLVRRGFTVREMAWLGDSSLTKRSLVRWFALSIGIMNPKDGRETVVDILDALFYFNFTLEKNPSVEDISNKTGVPVKTVYYHIKRLKDLGLVEQEGDAYFWSRDFNGDPGLDKFTENILFSINQSRKALREITGLYMGNGK